MKPISTGTGLIVLSATIATCFAASRFGGEERAFAESLTATHVDETGARSPSPRIPDSSLAACAEDAPLNWLSQTPQLISYCPQFSPLGVLNIGVADLNADGQAETFTRPNALHYPVYQGQINTTEPASVYRTTVGVPTDGMRTVRYSRVLETSQIGIWLREKFPTCFQVELVLQGWADVDGDGDLDLVGHIMIDLGPNDAVHNIWFENTGFQKAPAPNPYDLDQDGEVGAGDISVLLLNYSG